MSESPDNELPIPVSELADGETFNIPPEQDYYEELLEAAYEEDGDRPHAEPDAQPHANGHAPTTEEAFRRFLRGV